MKNRYLVELIPLTILTIVGVYSVIEVITTDYIFGTQQYLGLALLGISLILFFINRRIYKYVFGLTLLIGLLNLVAFSTTVITMSFLGLPIQILLLPLIAIFIWINKVEINSKIQNLLGATEAEAIEALKQIKIERKKIL